MLRLEVRCPPRSPCGAARPCTKHVTSFPSGASLARSLGADFSPCEKEARACRAALMVTLDAPWC